MKASRPTHSPTASQAGKALLRAVLIVVLAKMVALVLLKSAFFSADHQPHITAEGVDQAVFGFKLH